MSDPVSCHFGMRASSVWKNTHSMMANMDARME